MLKIKTLLITIFSFTHLYCQNHWENIINETDEFKYFLPTIEPTENWKSLNYDDSSWEAGFGGFGYGDNDDTTIIPSIKSIFLRKEFTISNTVKINNLIFNIDYDDAFVAYLNGVEIGRSKNIPNGTPSINENISIDHEAQLYSGGQPDYFTVDINLLNTESNILAIHILNIDKNSSDLSARIFLNAEISDSNIIFNKIPSWFKQPISYTSSNLPIIKINTEGKTIVDEPKIMAKMQIINNSNGINNFSDTQYEYDGDIGIEIRGNTSQGFQKKSYSLETRLSDGSNNNVSILGMPSENDWVLHGPYSDKSLMRNALAYSIGNAMGNGWHPRTQFVEVEINGEYNGIYLFVEKIKRDKNRVNIANLKPEDNSGDELTGGYIISIDRDQEGSWNSPFLGRTGSVDIPFSYVDPDYEDLTTQQRNYIKDYITDFEYSLNGNNFKDPNLGYRAYIDVESFVDYFIITELARDIDGYRVSVFFHKDKDSKGGKLTMTPFWDYNLCFGNANFFGGGDNNGWASDGIGNGDWYEIPFWWDRFREDPYFETVLKYRWEALRKNVLNKNTINNIIDSYHDILQVPQTRNFDKFDILSTYVWPNNYVGNTYANEVNYLKSWIDGRIDWIDAQINLIEPSFLSNNKLETNNIATVYPNPFNDKFTVALKTMSHSNIKIVIYNLLGQTVFQKNINSVSENQSIEITYNDLGNKGSMFIYKIIEKGYQVKSGIIVHK
ncbi:CotH kinase family protein [Wenyingzhuangia marina]|uniref:Por secretion system C-terminal sorting domain-containing protein n=1 Tax=Wenyingzhuangia marina TaxID=1195760 RepID=A0A1M5U5C6_9FLAO|nr:CotH kinase family protein [Wenyingzhuangia marina]GGF69515.1 hypothetical protein GCM10011397_10550 [Wenyingzhuangia marina]SHH58164.1 Por secretion system C-terminal sorting domain-containing protein [Wenyingzhuangia marina]